MAMTTNPTTLKPVPRARRVPALRLRTIVCWLFPLILAGSVGWLLQVEPNFYTERLCELEPEKRHQCNNQFLNTASRLINDLQNSTAWQATFREQDINGWLAEDFEANHAQKVLPVGVRKPRVEIQGDQCRLGFSWSVGPVSSVIQISARAWIPRRNLLLVEVESVKAGWLPLPTTYPRTVIEQFLESQSLEVSWKRNGSRLVALIDFTPVQRKVVLNRVEIRDGQIGIDGLSGHHAIPTIDYAPTAN